ncbi:MAG: alpha/beta hydrolase domain-containing protein, partial [Steroidobacteraceae bacterium]
IPQEGEEYRGYVWVGISAQKIGIHGAPGISTGLTGWDPERYGTLKHPGDAFSYDIFTQVTRLLGKNRPTVSPDPLRGLKPKMVIAQGGSQSSMRLASYINVAQKRDHVIDGFLLYGHWGLAPGLPDVSLLEQFAPTGRGRAKASSRINDTSGTPILVISGETEALLNYHVRQPDTNTFRFWEIAGAAHAASEMSTNMNKMFVRDGLSSFMPQLTNPNVVVWDPVRKAGIRRLVEWVSTGKPPQSMPLIEFDAGGPNDTPQIRRDRFGNAVGGIRMPELAVPTARHSGSNTTSPVASLLGESVPFEPSVIKELYPTKEAYVTAWNRAVDDLLKAGIVLPEDAAPMKAKAQSTTP